MAKKPTKAEVKAAEQKQQRRAYKAGAKVSNVRDRRGARLGKDAEKRIETKAKARAAEAEKAQSDGE